MDEETRKFQKAILETHEIILQHQELVLALQKKTQAQHKLNQVQLHTVITALRGEISEEKWEMISNMMKDCKSSMKPHEDNSAKSLARLESCHERLQWANQQMRKSLEEDN